MIVRPWQKGRGELTLSCATDCAQGGKVVLGKYRKEGKEKVGKAVCVAQQGYFNKGRTCAQGGEGEKGEAF